MGRVIGALWMGLVRNQKQGRTGRKVQKPSVGEMHRRFYRYAGMNGMAYEVQMKKRLSEL